MPGLTLAHLFDWHWANFKSFQGWMVTTARVANAFAVAAVLRIVVRRRRLAEPRAMGPREHHSAAAPHSAAELPTPRVPGSPQVERAKKCLDFASTFYLINLVVVCLFSGFPSTLAWCAVATDSRKSIVNVSSSMSIFPKC